MISQQVLDQIKKLVSPGQTLYYSELKDNKDHKTVSDKNGELTKALASNHKESIHKIIQAVYENTKYNGEVVNDGGKLKFLKNAKIYDLQITNTGKILSIRDGFNRMTTKIEYKAGKENEINLQEELKRQLLKRKMSNTELVSFIQSWVKDIK